MNIFHKPIKHEKIKLKNQEKLLWEGKEGQGKGKAEP